MDRTRLWYGVNLLIAALICPISAWGQTEATIIGSVTDSSGAMLPGVAVTATSPALQQRQVAAVTDERGEYRLSPLPIGIYEVGFALDGFQSARRESLRLTVGLTARVNMVMSIGALNESITVTGASPIVDVTSTATTTTLTRETLEYLPTSRNSVQTVLAQAPGMRTNVDVGGDQAGEVPSFRMYGTDAPPWTTIEGVLTTSPTLQRQSGNYQDFSTLEEVQIRPIGNNAEIAFEGVALSSVVKAGGNAFHANGWWTYSNPSLQSNNVDAALVARQVTGSQRITSRWDVSGDLGGRLVRDKLWFFGSVRSRANDTAVVNCFKPDGTPCEIQLDEQYGTGKLSYQANQSHRFIGFYQWNLKDRVSGASALRPWDSRSRQYQPSHVWKGQWQGSLSSHTVADAQVGYWDFRARTAGVEKGALQISDVFTGRSSGSGSSTGITDYGRYHARGSITTFRSTPVGNHDLKAGYDYMHAFIRLGGSNDPAGNYALVFNNGAPFQLRAANNPVDSISWDGYTSLYLQDNWRISRRLTMSLGVRFARDGLYVPKQSRVAGEFAAAQSFPQVDFAVWNSLVPRANAAYDLTGDGRTVVKGGWGRFARPRGVDEAAPVNQNSRFTTTYLWHDRNSNALYEPGEVDLNPNGSDFVSQTGGAGIPTLQNQIVNPSEQGPYTDQYSVTIERELMANFAVRATAVYSRQLNVRRLLNTLRPPETYTTAITRAIPDPNGVVPPGGANGTLTFYEYPSALRGLDFQVPMLVNDAAADRNYRTIEFAVTKRMDRWMMLASYSGTKIHDPLITNVGGNQSFPVNTVDPNAEIFAANNTWEWGVKVGGGAKLPFGFLASSNYEIRSGVKFARTALFTGGATIPSIVLPVEPFGSRQYPTLHLLDGRVEKTFPLFSHKVGVRIDIFNIMNINATQAATQQSGPNFGVPTVITAPRNVQFGVHYSF